MGCSVEFARTFFEIDAFVMLFDFTNIITNLFFDKYFEHSRDGICLKGVGGSLRPDFKAHRHDQSIASYWAKIFNILPINYGGWCYAHEVGKKFNPTFVKAGIEQLFNWHMIVDMHKEGKSIMGVSFL